MTRTEAVLAIHRILVALDASPGSLSALDTAARLAARMNAELQGIFVEEQALLRLAEISLAREVPYFSSAGVRLSRESIECKLRVQAEQIKGSLTASAERAGVASSFRSVRGQVAPALSNAAKEVDLLVLGGTGWSLRRRSRIGSTALEIISGSAPVLVLPNNRLSEATHLVVFFDGSEATERAIRAARDLARSGLDGVTILTPSGTTVPADLLEPSSTKETSPIQFRFFDPSSEAGLLQALRAERGSILVIGGRELLRDLPPLEVILLDLKMALLFLSTHPAITSHSRWQATNLAG